MALAEALRDAAGDRRTGPCCWSPGRPRSWSSARAGPARVDPPGHPARPDLPVLPEQSAPGRPGGPLLGGAGARDAAARAVILVDRNDPYSVDLAVCFRRAIERSLPRASRSSSNSAAVGPGPRRPGRGARPLERQQAEAIWKEATGPGGRTTWVILPLQGRPARRMLRRCGDLARYAPGPADGAAAGPLRRRDRPGDPLRAGRRRPRAAGLVRLVGVDPPAGPAAEAEESSQVDAEIVAAVIRALDRPGDARADLADALAKLELTADDPGAMGRSLAFTAGERRGDDLGHVLTIGPGQAEIRPTPGPPTAGGARRCRCPWSRSRPAAEAGAASSRSGPIP